MTLGPVSIHPDIPCLSATLRVILHLKERMEQKTGTECWPSFHSLVPRKGKYNEVQSCIKRNYFYRVINELPSPKY